MIDILFIKKSLFDEFGLYSLDYEVVSDFDFLVRIIFFRDNILNHGLCGECNFGKAIE